MIKLRIEGLQTDSSDRSVPISEATTCPSLFQTLPDNRPDSFIAADRLHRLDRNVEYVGTC